MAIAVTEDGREVSVLLSRNDLVAEVKARVVAQLGNLAGKLLQLTYRGKELSDDELVVR
jgi:hypothetical protein